MKIQLTGLPEYPFELNFQYDKNTVEICRAVKDKVGYLNFQYCKERKSWIFKTRIYPEIKKCFNVIIHKDAVELYSKEEELSVLETDKLIQSKQTPLNIEMPLYDYQRIGSNFAVQNKKVMINDDMGLGKTIQALAVARYLNLKSILIICPNGPKANWQKEIKMWLKKDSLIVEDELVRNEINIINYERLLKFSDITPRGKLFFKVNFDWQLVIIDESQYIKNNSAKRTKLVLDITKKAERVILLSASPISNAPVEYVTQIKALDKMNLFGSEWNFKMRYCNPKHNGFGWEFKGATNTDELRDKIASFSIRRMKTEVLKDLPPKRVYTTYLDMPEPKVYADLLEETTNELMETNRAYKEFYKSLAGLSPEQKNDKIIDYKLDKEMQTKTSNVLVQIEKLKQETARQKIIASSDIFAGHIENKNKVVVFGYHLKTVSALEKIYPQSLAITGAVKPEDRLKVIEEFESNERILFLFGNVQTLGIAFNLTKANRVMFVELGWTKEEHKQAEDRVWRNGQEQKVECEYLILKNSIDEDIYELINSKDEIVQQLNVPSALIKKLLINKQND